MINFDDTTMFQLNVEKEKATIRQDGFSVIENVYSPTELNQLTETINNVDSSKENFRKTKDLFAVRQFLKEVPRITEMVFNANLNTIVQQLFGIDYFVVRSIYFDKPQASNWFVAYHQDLTITLADKVETEGFKAWTNKNGYFTVQPPGQILERNFTVRIHLDDTDESNGALKVIPQSHLRGAYRFGTTAEINEHVCEVSKGGVMIMKPLLMHASGRTTNNQRRRVIHIEFSNATLPNGLNWSEFMRLS